MRPSWERVPPHLRRHLVEQDYDAYDEIDQAVWRFTLRHAQRLLHDMAHPAYVQGLPATGITLDRIPRLQDVDRRLSELGWGAVCVDGFIPPRAFFALQAARLLPIAADIRSHDHLAYTPAPDIIHEAAGHAPLLAHPEYGAFLRDIGRVGQRAFALPHDHTVYQAIYALSVVKERVGVTAAEVRASEDRLAEAIAAVDGVSEAGLLARLYWWTVEYGLIGSVDDYRLFGAGLLSSLREAFYCHGPDVQKLPLSAACIDVDYDITRAQPQLFVAESFAHLSEVLRQVEGRFVQARGGRAGLECARRSGEIATVELDTGAQVIGRVASHSACPDEHDLCRMDADSAIAWRGRLLRGQPRGPALLLDAAVLDRLGDGAPAVDIPLSTGHRLQGRLGAVLRAPDGTRLAVTWLEGVLTDPGGTTLCLSRGWLVPATQTRRVLAGAIDAAYHAPSTPSGRRVPGPKPASAEREALLVLYERARGAWQAQLGAACVPLFERIHGELQRAHPDEWLLRWNLLESLVALGEHSRLTASLVSELHALERRYRGQQPILTGLDSLAVEAHASLAQPG